jgi:uncharacterized protein (DUF1684 family)
MAIIVLVGIVLYSFQDSSDDDAYIQKIEAQRSQKDQYMRTAEESPFAKLTDEFHGLNYFPVDPTYRISATLVPIQNKKTIILPTSDDKEKHYLEYAYAEFEMDGKKNRLLILEIMEMGPYRGTLFLAFGDETSTNETYGAGRYLDIKKVPGSISITLDFNEAYNPYCAYNDEYSCPFPPRENLMEIPIRAGEKNYIHHED